MTSNLGSHVIQELAGGENYETMKTAVMDIVGQHFRPEFINRIDETVVFKPFDPVYGARPLKRAIQQQVENELAQHILAGKFEAGDTVYIGVDGDALSFDKEERVTGAVH